MEIKDEYLPWNEEAEQGVLGSLLSENYRMAEVRELISDINFHDPSNRLIFGAMCAADEADQPFDMITLPEFITDKELFMSFGGFGYLAELANNTPMASRAVSYARLVKGKSDERQVLLASRDMRRAIAAPDGTSEDKINNAMALFNAVDFDAESDADEIYKDQVKAFLIDYMEKYELGSEITGLATGFEDIDKLTCGLQESNLIIVAGLPGSGKSTLSMNIATNIASDALKSSEGHVLVFNMEMGAGEIIGRQAAYLGGVHMNAIKSPKKIDDDDGYGGFPALNMAIKTIKDLPMTVDARPALTPEQVRSKALRTMRKHGKLSLIVVDYMQLMEVNGSKGNLATDTTKISKSMKRLAKDMKCPVIALSQLNRKCMERQDKRPIMSDLRDSGSIEQDADIIAFVHRESNFISEDEDNPFIGFAEIIIAKNRSGECGTIPMRCRLEKNTFMNLGEFPFPKREFKQNKKQGGFKR